MTRSGTPDPQWDYTLAIRAALELHGRFEAEVDLRDTQAIVDLRWAALQAGRLLGAGVTVDLGAPAAGVEHIVSASVLLVDGSDRCRAEEGLRRLRECVHHAQEGGIAPSGIPAPRGALPTACD